MQIGALIGLFVALLFVITVWFSNQRKARKINADPVMVLMYGGRVAYHVSRGRVIIICMFGATGGAIVGWLVS